MTDFGSRLGLGDMLKSVYDANRDGVVDSVIAHKLSHQLTGSDQISVAGLLGELAAAQPSAWAKVTGKPTTFAPSGHKASHESGGTDPISVTGLVGTTPRAILGDGTAGRVFRACSSYFGNGTNANTIKSQTTSLWNGDVIALVDNIAKGATTDGFTLSSDGTLFTIENSGLSGNVLFAFGCITSNSYATDLVFALKASGNDIAATASNATTGQAIDLTTLVDTGLVYFQFFYITDA